MAKDPDFWYSTDDPGPERHNANWMQKVSDSKYLSELSIPGTHNTMSYAYSGGVGLWVWCQSWTLPIQLNMGIRFLDLRCCASKGDMSLHHGPKYLGENLTNALDGIVRFLQTHPKECVILRIKQENSHLYGRDFRDALQPFLDRVSVYILKQKSMPTLREARGKIVILANYEIIETDQLLQYGKMEINICDNHRPGSLSVKMSGIQNNIYKAALSTRDKKDMYITFTSYTILACCPREVARRSNPKFHDLVRRHQGCLGIVVMDYPGYQIPRDIINHN